MTRPSSSHPQVSTWLDHIRFFPKRSARADRRVKGNGRERNMLRHNSKRWG